MLLKLLGYSKPIPLHDHTDSRQSLRSIEHQRSGDPLGDPTFIRHVDRVTDADERARKTERILRTRRAWSGAAALLALAAIPATAAPPIVLRSTISPDARYRVELADYRQPTVFELFVSQPGSPAAPRKIGGQLPPDHDVSGFQISPDSQHVVYRQGQTAQVVGGNWRLYVVPITGGQVVNLTPILVPGGNVEPVYTLLPGDRVRWIADATVDETYQSFEASIAVRIFSDGFESGSVGAWR